MSGRVRCLVCTAPDCSRKFRDSASMQQHQAEKHPNLMKRLACNECGHLFKDHKDLHQHQQVSPGHRQISLQQNGSGSSCFLCGDIFSLPVDLANHFLSKHPVAKLSGNDPERNKVAIDFIQSWRHTQAKPKVLSVFKVHNPGERMKSFVEYRAKLKQSNHGEANEVFRYHGTSVKCGLGVSSDALCSNVACNLCSIIQGGFKKKKAEVSGFLRFGVGIYVTKTSSKANDYVEAYGGGRGGDGGGRSRAMLVCKVCAGRVCEKKFDEPELLEPPEGFDSVAGVPGGSLNYDELVVYSNAALLPQFVIVYNV